MFRSGGCGHGLVSGKDGNVERGRGGIMSQFSSSVSDLLDSRE